MKKYIRECINRVKPYVPGKPIEEVERELSLAEVIKLASNEHPIGPSPKALRAIRKGLKNINRYPDASSFYLKRALAKHLKVEEKDLITGNGSDEIISIALRTFVGEGDEVVIAKPTFLMYEIASQIAGARIIQVPLKDYKYNLPAMLDEISSGTKMVFIANPDNPTGRYVTKRELSDFLKRVPKGVVVFLDEAYFEFAKNLKDYPDGLDYIEGMPNLIVSRTFSKAYGLSGLRVGYAVANPELISYLERVREPFNVNILAQYAGCAALEDKRFLKMTLDHVRREKEFLYSAFRAMNLRYIESATNFILFDAGMDCKVLFKKLLEKGVIVRDMKAWGWDTFIRVTIGTRRENLKFLNALKEVLG